MISILKNLNVIFTIREKLRVFYLSSISIIVSILDVISIGLVVPILGMLLKKIDFNTNKYLNLINQLFNYTLTEYLVFFIFIFFIFLVIFKNLFQIFFSYILTKFLIRLHESIQKKIYFNYINKEFKYLINTHTSEIFKDIDYETSIFTNGLLSPLIIFLSNVFLLICFSFFLFYYNFEATLIISFLIFITFFFFKIFIFKKVKQWGYLRQALQKNYTKILKETFDVIKEIKLLKIDQYFIRIFSQTLRSQRSVNTKQSFTASLMRPITEIVFIIFLVVIILLGWREPEKIIIDISVYIAVAFRLVPSINIILVSYQRINSSVSCLSRIKDIILTYRNLNALKEENNYQVYFNKNIKLQNINIKHPGIDKLILDDISFIIPARKKIGLMGASGSGKTTFLNTIIGFVKPISGKILVDDFILDDDLLISSWQKMISYVPQNIILFDKSLIENITLSFDKKLNSSENIRYQNAIIFAQLNDLEEKLRVSGETVGEMGSKVSRGEAQRIGIARALYMDCKILILDESTNFLDKQTENAFLAIIKNYMKNFTILFVSHKQSSLELICDEIYKIENKKFIKIK